jgi:hypothetical protein
VAPLTVTQRRRRDRIECGIRLAAPLLDAVLWAGEQIARVAGREDSGYDPPRRPAPDSPVRTGARR